MILNWISDHKTVENVSNCSSFFRNIVKDSRVDFLAPEVMKIMGLTGYLVTRRWHIPSRPSSYTARQVCKSWCAGVDDSYEQHPYNTMKFTSAFDEVASTDNLPPSRELDRDNALYLENHFDATHAYTDRNPFLGRKITVCTRSSTNYLMQVLQIYGQHVWCLKISDHEIIHVERLYNFLSALPNLRRLEIHDWARYNKNTAFTQLPLLPNLETFKGKLEVAMQSGIVNANPSIVNLQLNIRTYADLQPVDFPYVKNLKIGVFSKLRPLNLNTPMLSKLNVYFRDELYDFGKLTRKDYFLRWQRIFNFINRNWGNAEQLADVELELPGFSSFITTCSNLSRAANYRLTLKNVENLKLLMRSPCSLDFLLPMCKSLKKLRVRIVYFSGKLDRSQGIYRSLEAAKKVQRIQILGFEERLYESNIWEKFPNLHEVVFEGHLKYATTAYRYRYTHRHCCDENKLYTRREWACIRSL